VAGRKVSVENKSLPNEHFFSNCSENRQQE
jgi:hypothetical protein